MSANDPYRHHPELRGRIADPETSFHRTLTNDRLEELTREHGLPGGWWYPDETREALRAETLVGHRGRDLWVFAYGSLMWDPAIRFAEVRRARIGGFARRFILLETFGGRGTAEAPGLMAALDTGVGCEGLAFRIEAEAVEEETRILWQREIIAPGYLARFVDAALHGGGRARVLAFVADPAADMVEADLDRPTQVRYLATGEGLLGSSADYLRNIVTKLRELGIEDGEMTTLLDEVEAYRNSRPG